MLPEAGFVESEPPGQIDVMAQLPLTDNAGRVAGLLEQVAEGNRLRVDGPETDVVPHVVQAGHHLHAGGRAQRLHETMREANTRARQLIKLRRPVACAAVGADGFITEIIGHDENNVRPAR